jgi:hypothetical protein
MSSRFPDTKLKYLSESQFSLPLKEALLVCRGPILENSKSSKNKKKMQQTFLNL